MEIGVFGCGCASIVALASAALVAWKASIMLLSHVSVLDLSASDSGNMVCAALGMNRR